MNKFVKEQGDTTGKITLILDFRIPRVTRI